MEAAVKGQMRSSMVTLKWLDMLTGGAITKANSQLGGGGSQQGSESGNLPSVPFSVSTAGTSSEGYGSQASSALKLDINTPLLSLVPTPYLRVQDLTVDFNMQLHNTSDAKDTDTSNENIGGGGDTGGLLGELMKPISFHGNYTDTNIQSGDSTVNEQYTMHVTMNCVQDAVPPGMDKILDIFANMVQQAAAGQIQAQVQQIQNSLNPQGGQQGTIPGGNA